ncbi:MAG: DUF2061 domain-containing protein [Promethearchaeota archaeon]
MKEHKIEWKESLVKSLIYRSITLVLGTLTAYLITGSIAIATGTALLTEAVQSVNYFAYEMVWSNVSRRKLEKRIIEKFERREIELKLDFSSIKELAYQLSQIDTFVPEIYFSTIRIFDNMLKNENLKDIHEEIEKYKEYFKTVHSGRDIMISKESEK